MSKCFRNAEIYELNTANIPETNNSSIRPFSQQKKKVME